MQDCACDMNMEFFSHLVDGIFKREYTVKCPEDEGKKESS